MLQTLLKIQKTVRFHRIFCLFCDATTHKIVGHSFLWLLCRPIDGIPDESSSRFSRLTYFRISTIIELWEGALIRFLSPVPLTASLHWGRNHDCKSCVCFSPRIPAA